MSDILQDYCKLTKRCQDLESELEGINLRRKTLAQQLFERDGKGHVYDVNGTASIIVKSSKGKYFFTPRDKWKNRPRKPKKAAKTPAEATPVKPKTVEVSATLNSSATVSTTKKADPLAAALAEVGNQS